MRFESVSRPAVALLTLSAFTLLVREADAGGRGRYVRRAPVVAYPTAAVVPAPPRAPAPLGSGFVKTPYIMTRGSYPAGGGYTPLDSHGDQTMALYGPLSGFRFSTAPVVTYSRGYDGRPVVAPGNSFSAPNLPALTPVIYPTQATYFYGFRQTGDPPWWGNGMGNWIDQN